MKYKWVKFSKNFLKNVNADTFIILKILKLCHILHFLLLVAYFVGKDGLKTMASRELIICILDRMITWEILSFLYLLQYWQLLVLELVGD